MSSIRGGRHAKFNNIHLLLFRECATASMAPVFEAVVSSRDPPTLSSNFQCLMVSPICWPYASPVPDGKGRIARSFSHFKGRTGTTRAKSIDMTLTFDPARVSRPNEG
ncbi:hypothetical protein GWK47_024912 [Chionoecetes opilio]|uniref:Uncharacterized protein n=1 Tax=Chionoecetes opilio TaxID=41210 RepID=A0A8J4XKV0_CHIOP|nr:hypothetical protein GWK47_024912 [Chionoecetes opilio]